MTDFSHVAVLVPCLNEEKTIAKVVADHRRALPGAVIYVFDNRSTDRTADVAAAAGAVVVASPRRGKGNVVRHMFDAVEAEIYVMVDGDDTYPATSAPDLVREIAASGVGMVVGARAEEVGANTFRPFHRFGNQMISKLISVLFSVAITDALSGYRAFTRSFVKIVPLTSAGFEIETELTLQAVSKRLGVEEIPIRYGERPVGSFSKLSTFSDGFLILKAILQIFKDFKPLPFFVLLTLLFTGCSLAAATPPILDYVRYKYVFHVPLAVLAAALAVVAVLSLGIGLVLDTTHKYHRENFELLRRLIQSQKPTVQHKAKSSRDRDATGASHE